MNFGVLMVYVVISDYSVVKLVKGRSFIFSISECWFLSSFKQVIDKPGNSEII